MFTRFASHRSLRFAFGAMVPLFAFAAFAVAAVRKPVPNCAPTAYTVTGSVTGNFNWTDTSGILWSPSGSYPGENCTGDSAADSNPGALTIFVNTPISGSLSALTFNCPNCLIVIQSGGSLTLAGSGSLQGGASIVVDNGGSFTVTNGSTLDVNGSTLTVNAGGTVLNGGTITVDNGGVLQLNGGAITGSGSIDNTGTISQNSGSSTISNAVNDNAGGTFSVSGGTLTLSGFGTADAPITIAGGATLDITNGYTTTANGTVSGAGTLQIDGGTVSIGAATHPLRFTMNGGSLTGSGSLTINNVWTWNGGSIGATGGMQLGATAEGDFNGSSGQMIVNAATLDLLGSVSYSGTGIALSVQGGSTMNVSATFNITGNGSIGATVSTDVINVQATGVFEKSGGTGTSVIHPQLNSAGTVDVLSGTLLLFGNGNDTGPFNVSAGATLAFSAGSTFASGNINAGSGTVSFLPGFTSVSGTYAANVTIIGGSASIANTATTTTFAMSGGSLNVSNTTFTVTGSGTWSGGSIGGTKFVVASGVPFTIDAANTNTTIAGEFDDNGTVNYTATTNLLQLQNGTLIVNGTFDIRTDQPINVALPAAMYRPQTAHRGLKAKADALLLGSGSITNNGTFEKTAGSGTTTIAPTFTNNATVLALSGTMDFTSTYTQTAGTTTLGPGSITIASPLQLNGGTLDGAGTLTGDLQNAAIVAPGSATSVGTITLTGNYTQTAAGALDVKIGSSGNDLLATGGADTLAGTFTASSLNGYEPPSGASFTVLTFASRSGDFTTYNFPPDQFGPIGASYTPTSLVVAVGPASTDLAAGMSGPATVNAAAPLSYTVTITNNGPNTAVGTITVVDTLPAGVTAANGSGTNWSCGAPSGGTITCTNAMSVISGGSLPALTFNMTAPPDGGSITNSATVSNATDPNSANNTAAVTTTVVPQADLSITKSGPIAEPVGSNVTWTITVTNNGPSSATNVSVSDPTPAGLTFVSNSGACTTAFPCSLGTLTSGQSATIMATFAIPSAYAGASTTNTATVSASTADPNAANNSATVTMPVSPVADLSITKSTQTAFAPAGTNVTFRITVVNAGPSAAPNVVVSDPTPSGLTWVSNSGACATAFPCNVGTLAANQGFSIDATYAVTPQARALVVNTASVTSSAIDPNAGNNSASAQIRTVPPPPCPTDTPQILTPPANANVLAPVNLSWSDVAGAVSYTVTITANDGTTKTITTTTTSATVDLPGGTYTWTVIAQGDAGCQPISSAGSTFTVCTTPGQPLVSVVGEATTGQTFTVQWNAIDGAGSYEVQQAGDPSFTFPTITTVTTTSTSYTFTAATATPFYYRVRAISMCNNLVGPFSDPVRIVVIPMPSPTAPGGPSVNAPHGSTQTLTFPVFIPGLPGGKTQFTASVDQPWLSVSPTTGVVPPEGITVDVTVDPTGLPNGTWTGSIIIVYGNTTPAGRYATNGATTTSVPVSINIVTPVSPGTLGTPSANALIIPSVGHLSGATSEWRSDVRIANPTSSAEPLQVTFNDGTSVRNTTVNVGAGTTMALDDIARAWFGVGSLGDSANGTLTIDPVAPGRRVEATDVSKTTSTVVTSRTYNESANGTLGQFIPAVPFANFLSAANASPLILQQIAQSSAFRTNLGIVEGAGKAASVLVSTFDASGNKLFDVPVDLQPGQQKQINSFLAQHGATGLTNGHIEVKQTGGDGKVTAYASVVDNLTSDPFLISGVPLGNGATRFVVPGVADLNNGNADWRTDVRIFNGSGVTQPVTLTFFPTGNPNGSVSKDVALLPGEVRALDGILQSMFGLTNTGGVLHVTTATATPLVVSARTFDQTSSGTLGQFIPATTLDDAVGNGDRSLQLVQLEDSPRYRTNVGVAEVSGNPATVEISVFVPGSKVTPKTTIALGAYDFRQFPILSALGLGNVYNARVAVRVIDGTGKVTAYGSVIDQKTQAPVFVPAQ